MGSASNNRHRFRFSLRGLLISVTMLCIVAGWFWHARDWQRRRAAALHLKGIYGNQKLLPLLHRPLAPGGLWMLGEHGHPVLRISTPCVSDSEIREIQRVFPESTLWLRANESRWSANVAPGETLPAVIGRD